MKIQITLLLENPQPNTLLKINTIHYKSKYGHLVEQHTFQSICLLFIPGLSLNFKLIFIYTYDLKYLTAKMLQTIPITRFESEGYSDKCKVKMWQGYTSLSINH